MSAKFWDNLCSFNFFMGTNSICTFSALKPTRTPKTNLIISLRHLFPSERTVISYLNFLNQGVFGKGPFNSIFPQYFLQNFLKLFRKLALSVLNIYSKYSRCFSSSLKWFKSLFTFHNFFNFAKIFRKTVRKIILKFLDNSLKITTIFHSHSTHVSSKILIKIFTKCSYSFSKDALKFLRNLEKSL